MACDHSGMHSGATRYSRQTGQLRQVVICDQCGAECRSLGVLDYRPDPRFSEGQTAPLRTQLRASRGA
jgi:hypothetical protein